MSEISKGALEAGKGATCGRPSSFPVTDSIVPFHGKSNNGHTERSERESMSRTHDCRSNWPRCRWQMQVSPEAADLACPAATHKRDVTYGMVRCCVAATATAR